MKNIFYKPTDGWVGDTIPFAHDGKFYIHRMSMDIVQAGIC